MDPIVDLSGTGLVSAEEAVWSLGLPYFEQHFAGVVLAENEPDDNGCPLRADSVTSCGCPYRVR